MGRVAIVTGGTRGIGRAICERLRDERECKVIANYAGNDNAAKKFTEETGIPTVKFDVSDFDAVQEACKRIEEEHGPIEIVVNKDAEVVEKLVYVPCDNEGIRMSAERVDRD